jgi:competence protein ComEA
MKKKWAIIGGVLLVIIGAVLQFRKTSPSTTSEPIIETPPIRIIVQITGEVNRPGLYELNDGSRLHELITIAGGFTPNAKADSINLASTLQDGDHIMVSKATSSLNANGLISINQASKEELLQLQGIGEAKANNIIAYRNLHGPFAKLEDLMKVSGISSSIYDNIKNKICL